eukprot:1154637-Pelagomonas_calceolata.AAC.1
MKHMQRQIPQEKTCEVPQVPPVHKQNHWLIRLIWCLSKEDLKLGSKKPREAISHVHDCYARPDGKVETEQVGWAAYRRAMRMPGHMANKPPDPSNSSGLIPSLEFQRGKCPHLIPTNLASASQEGNAIKARSKAKIQGRALLKRVRLTLLSENCVTAMQQDEEDGLLT